MNLALVMNVDGTPTNVAIAQLGDRVGIDGLTITENGLVVVDMVAQGPSDPMCCPTMPVTRIYAYTGDAYKQLAPVAEVAGHHRRLAGDAAGAGCDHSGHALRQQHAAQRAGAAQASGLVA